MFAENKYGTIQYKSIDCNKLDHSPNIRMELLQIITVTVVTLHKTKLLNSLAAKNCIFCYKLKPKFRLMSNPMFYLLDFEIKLMNIMNFNYLTFYFCSLHTEFVLSCSCNMSDGQMKMGKL